MLKPVLTLMGAIALCTLPWLAHAAGPSAKTSCQWRFGHSRPMR